MSKIWLRDAAKHDKSESHQIAAWNWLQEQLTAEQISQFADIYRAGPPIKPPAQAAPSKREQAWLAVIRYAEGTAGTGGYETTFAYKRKIDTSKPHPGIVNTANGYSSDASGAYQFLSTTWKDIHGGKNPAMTPGNQDRAAIALIKRRGVDPSTAAFTPANVAKLAPEWASLPTLEGKSFYGQPVKTFAELQAVFSKKMPEVIEQQPARITPSSPFSARMTPHITLGEFALNQEARRFTAQHQVDTAAELAAFMERARRNFGGKPVIITSGYRPAAVNRAVGGASNSEHLYGKPSVGAVDFYILGVDIYAVQAFCDKYWPYSVGLGAPKGFVHLGIREGRPKVRWDY